MLTSIEIDDFRCIERADIQFDPRGTGIIGSNGSGKTSLLEAIYFLGHGRSFRTATRSKLIRRGAAALRVVARVDDAGRSLVAGAEHGRGITQMRLGGHGVSSVVDIAAVLPTQIIDPGVHRLIDEGSLLRRRLLDWGVFHVEPTFFPAWRRYRRSLEQRNAAIRTDASDDVLRPWEVEMAQAALVLDAARSGYANCLREHFSRLAGEFLGEDVEFDYRRGWGDESLDEALRLSVTTDRRHATTTVGPHRADLTIRAGGVLARDRVSRGQQKLLASALILAQIRALNELQPSATTCLLLDDPAAELDVDKLGKLLNAVERTSAQLVVTSLNRENLAGFNLGGMFHVEQGKFTRML